MASGLEPWFLPTYYDNALLSSPLNDLSPPAGAADRPGDSETRRPLCSATWTLLGATCDSEIRPDSVATTREPKWACLVQGYPQKK